MATEIKDIKGLDSYIKEGVCIEFDRLHSERTPSIIGIISHIYRGKIDGKEHVHRVLLENGYTIDLYSGFHKMWYVDGIDKGDKMSAENRAKLYILSLDEYVDKLVGRKKTRTLRLPSLNGMRVDRLKSYLSIDNKKLNDIDFALFDYSREKYVRCQLFKCRINNFIGIKIRLSKNKFIAVTNLERNDNLLHHFEGAKQLKKALNNRTYVTERAHVFSMNKRNPINSLSNKDAESYSRYKNLLDKKSASGGIVYNSNSTYVITTSVNYTGSTSTTTSW